MPSRLDQLKALTLISAEDADTDALRRHRPHDCSVTPRLLVTAARSPEGKELMSDAIVWGRSHHGVTSRIADRLLVSFGVAMAGLVPGRVATEIDADLAYDIDGMVEKGRALVADYGHRGVGRHRILLDLPGTWEGIEAARFLQSEGIDCNVTLVFSLAQAAAAAEAGAFMVSVCQGGPRAPARSDRGLAERIADYLSAHAMETAVNAVRVSTVDEMHRLAGVARLTLTAEWLDRLAQDDGTHPTPPPDATGAAVPARMALDEKSFRFMLNEDGLAEECLADGVRQAVRRLRALRQLASRRLDGLDPLAGPIDGDFG